MALDKETKEKFIKDFGINPNDTGSVQVQIAMLTENIKKLTEHMKENHKDFSSKRGLLNQVERRKTFLKYLAKNDPKGYTLIIEKLGLKK